MARQKADRSAAAVRKRRAQKATKMGKTVVTTSVGDSGADFANLPGSKADPDVETHPREPREFGEHDYSKVTVTLGITKSLSDFEFARVSVSIEDFCLATPEERLKCYETAKSEASSMIGGVLKKIMASKKKGNR